MNVPEGLKTTTNSKKVCNFLKSLYGLKQSPPQWYLKIHEFLLKIGFSSSSNDPSLYIRHLYSGIALVALYVDDLLIAVTSASEIQPIKNKLNHRFEMKIMGEAKVILGIEISRNRSTQRLFIKQSEYIWSVLERFRMTKSKSVATSMGKAYFEIPPGTTNPPKTCHIVKQSEYLCIL